MTARLLLAMIFLLTAAAPPARAAEPARIVYLGVADDPWYERQTVYTGLSLRDRTRPVDGARLAIKGARVIGRALGVDFILEETLLAPGAPAASAIRAARDAGALAVLLDLPEDAMTEAVATEGALGLLVNIRDIGDRWRGEDCAPRLVHTMPSRAMLTDALAQHLRVQGWERILLLRGPLPDDIAEAEAVRDSAEKFGLEIVDEREFEVTNDPRRRDLSNIALLTGGARYDVVWLADSEGEFGRYVPYATREARPVVGSEGLRARAWDWTWERNGAPQLNQRFRRLAGRDMTPEDWAAWAGVQAVVEGVTRAGTDPETVVAHVLSDALALDLYKGVRGNFRAWDGQLRQPILLATHNAVIANAPLDGFEHQTDTLDTLGADRSESACRR